MRLLTSAAADTALNPDLRQFAQKPLPTLEHHQVDAKRLNEQATAAGDSPAAAQEE